MVAGEAVLATAPLADLSTSPDPPVVIANVLFPALTGVGRGHGATVTLAHRIITDARDGLRSTGDTGLAGGQCDITD